MVAFQVRRCKLIGKKRNETVWKRISWSAIFEMKLICTTFLSSNSYCIICEETVRDGGHMRSFVLFCEFVEGFKLVFLEKVKRMLKRG